MTEKRTSLNRQEINIQIAREFAGRLNDWADGEWDSAEKDLLSALTHSVSYDGYVLAKKLEDAIMIEPDDGLVEILSEVAFRTIEHR